MRKEIIPMKKDMIPMRKDINKRVVKIFSKFQIKMQFASICKLYFDFFKIMFLIGYTTYKNICSHLVFDFLRSAEIEKCVPSLHLVKGFKLRSSTLMSHDPGVQVGENTKTEPYREHAPWEQRNPCFHKLICIYPATI